MTITTTREISNGEDVIDSREISERIAYLASGAEDDELDNDELEELDNLRAVAEQASGSPDWQYGETLIRDSYFEEYAQQLAEDIGAVDRNASWPLSYIDWEAAAYALKYDYATVTFYGVMYWIRA
jgi:hypothetical protein